MKPPLRFDDYLRFIVDYPHDYGARLNETVEGKTIWESLTLYDHFIFGTFHDCFNQLAQESGMTPILLGSVGFSSVEHLKHCMPDYQRLSVAYSEINALRQKKWAEDNK